MNKFYTYVLINSLDNQPLYIGKGINKRCYKHLPQIIKQKHLNEHLQRKGNLILSAGGTIIVKIFYTESEQDAFDTEVAWIKQARTMKSGICNMTDGGSGGNVYQYLTEEKLNEVKQKISEIHKGKVFDKEYRKKISVANKGQVPWSNGVKRPEFAEKMKLIWAAKKAAGWKYPEDGRLKMIETKRNKKKEQQ